MNYQMIHCATVQETAPKLLDAHVRQAEHFVLPYAIVEGERIRHVHFSMIYVTLMKIAQIKKK